MSANAEHFASTVLNGFKAARLFTVKQVEAAGGPSSTTMTKLRKAQMGEPLARPRSDTFRRIDAAAKWPDGSAVALWETGELPNDDMVRLIGSGGVPAPEATIYSSEARAEMGDELVFQVITKAIDRLGNESILELRYLPGEGREVTLVDLSPAAANAHREALRATYVAGTRRRLNPVREPEIKAPNPASSDDESEPVPRLDAVANVDEIEEPQEFD